MTIFLDQTSAVVRAELQAKKLAGHAISAMKSFGTDVVPRGEEGRFPYLVLPSPSFARVATSCTALYYRGTLTHSIYDRNDDNLQLYLGYLEGALEVIYDNPVEFTSRMPERTGVDEIIPGTSELRRLGDGMYCAKWMVMIGGRVLR